MHDQLRNATRKHGLHVKNRAEKLRKNTRRVVFQYLEEKKEERPPSHHLHHVAQPVASDDE